MERQQTQAHNGSEFGAPPLCGNKEQYRQAKSRLTQRKRTSKSPHDPRPGEGFLCCRCLSIVFGVLGGRCLARSIPTASGLTSLPKLSTVSSLVSNFRSKRFCLFFALEQVKSRSLRGGLGNDMDCAWHAIRCLWLIVGLPRIVFFAELQRAGSHGGHLQKERTSSSSKLSLQETISPTHKSMSSHVNTTERLVKSPAIFCSQGSVKDPCKHLRGEGIIHGSEVANDLIDQKKQAKQGGCWRFTWRSTFLDASPRSRLLQQSPGPRGA